MPRQVLPGGPYIAKECGTRPPPEGLDYGVFQARFGRCANAEAVTGVACGLDTSPSQYPSHPLHKTVLSKGRTTFKTKKDPWASPPASHIIQHRPDGAKLVSRCTDPYCHNPSELVRLRTLQKDPHLRRWGASVHAHVAPCQMYRRIKRGLCRDRDLSRQEETGETRHRGCPHQRRIVGHR